MKNYLSYYYDINVTNIHHIKNEYHFILDSYDYIFFEYNENPEKANEVYDFSLELLGKGIYCHQIILNKEKKIITYLNGKPYILMRCYQNLEQEVSLNDIILFGNLYINSSNFMNSNWKKMWEQKIDYLEYQISQFGNNHLLLRNSFNYFSGFVETGIQLMNEIDFSNSNNLVLSHKRIKESYTHFDLYNPFNFIIDFKVRDFCEYIKDQIMVKKNTSSLFEIKKIIFMYISNNNLSKIDIQLFFVRLLYPSFYFDVFEELIVSSVEDQNNDQLKKILDSANNYETIVIDIYNYLFENNYLPLIEWLKFN